MMSTPLLNVGIFAHVDAGKTTTTEHILYTSGRIRTPGRVDDGTALTDSLEVERQRGISVRAAMTNFTWKGTQVNLIDTPGHVDFLSEVERSLRVMDCAVLVISAVEGVQAQTEMIWNALLKLRIPTILFVNKMDRVGADPDAVLAQARKYLSPDIVPVQHPLGMWQDYQGAADLWSAGGEAAAADAGSLEAFTAARSGLIEALAERDEALLEAYLSGEDVAEERWERCAEEQARSARIYPLLYVQWLQEERELHVKVMGPIQLEVLSSVMESRYGLKVTFGKPSVIYKETPKQAGEGFIAYTMPKPCWAILRFQIEPGPRGSGLVYEARVRDEDLLPQYQNEVARRVPEALQQGLYGWEVTDLKVTLVYGQHHVWHTHPLDFAVATPMGIMNGLANTGTQLLEPILHVRIVVPEENAGRVMNDLVQMRGRFEPPQLQGERVLIEGHVPLSTSLDYPIELSSYTKGRSTFASSFAGYEPCPPDVHAERVRRGVNPLDQAKYILSVRKALQG